MGIIEQIFLAIGLAMDAFAVSICKGLSVKKIKPRHLVITGLYLAVFRQLCRLSVIIWE